MNYHPMEHSDTSFSDTEESKENIDIQRKISKLSEKMNEKEEMHKNELKKELILEREIKDSAKALRCKLLQKMHKEDFPESFFRNSNKEKLILEHIKKYNKMFQNIYGQRDLLLFPRNEMGCQKFICSTIRPTKLGYVKLFDFRKCAEFVSNFVQYETLQDCLTFPLIVPSPFNVLKWQKGDALDISLVLASLLLGAGFDAFVVVGTAEKFITLKRVVFVYGLFNRNLFWTVLTWDSLRTSRKMTKTNK
jgi:hypothetical protein